MAGIGFELKKLFSRKGMLATLRAYGYAGIVCAGPMILGFVLLLGILFMAEGAGATREDRELLVSMVTYCLVTSLTITSIFSMLTTRATADMLFKKDRSSVMPTFYGSLLLMFCIGVPVALVFLYFAGIPLQLQIMCFILFSTLIVVWTEINYLTAIKDYRSIMLTFSIAILVAFILALILIYIFKMEVIYAMFISIIVAYGIMMVTYFILLYRYFPEGFGTSFKFLKWFDQFPQLALVGFFINCGLFGHLIIMWCSRIQVQLTWRGEPTLFYGAPSYDVPAIMAFFCILITTINFMTSVEVRFYPQYRDYFSLFNDGGSLDAIENAEGNMLRVLKEELGYLAQKQLLCALIFIVIGSIILPTLPLGFNSEMLGTFRTLCVGYSFYAIGNSIMLISLYFADNKGALLDAAVFFVFSNLFSILFMNGNSAYFGFGLVIGGALFCAVAWARMGIFLGKLKFHVLSQQPMFAKASGGVVYGFVNKMEKRAAKKQKGRYRRYVEEQEKKRDKRIEQLKKDYGDDYIPSEDDYKIDYFTYDYPFSNEEEFTPVADKKKTRKEKEAEKKEAERKEAEKKAAAELEKKNLIPEHQDMDDQGTSTRAEEKPTSEVPEHQDMDDQGISTMAYETSANEVPEHQDMDDQGTSAMAYDTFTNAESEVIRKKILIKNDAASEVAVSDFDEDNQTGFGNNDDDVPAVVREYYAELERRKKSKNKK